jgi:hypothetical protein
VLHWWQYDRNVTRGTDIGGINRAEPSMPCVFARTSAGFILVLLCLGAARAAEPAGNVVAIAGDCFVEAEGKRTPLKMGDGVHVADTIDVPSNAKLKLRMNDGSIVSVASGSQMTIAAYLIDADGKRHEAALSLTQGVLRAVVSPVDRPSTFEIKTAVGAAGARSTDWFVEMQPGQMVVGVVAGTVVLQSAGTGAEVTIPAGSGASAATGQDPTAPRVWRKAEFNALSVRTDFPQTAAPKPPSPRRSTPRSSEPAEPDAPSAYPPPNSPSGGYNPNAGGSYNPGSGQGYQPPYGGYSPPSGGGGYGGRSGGGYQSPSGTGGRPY